MASDPIEERPNVDAIVAELQARVAERRAQGAYPDGLEEDLDGHFRRIIAHRSEEPFDYRELHERLRVLDAQMAFSRARIPLDTSVPGGDFAHKVVGKAVARQIDGVLTQVFEFADGVREILRRVVAALENPHSHMHAELIGQIDAVFDRLATYERAPADSGVALADLRRRVEELERAEAKRRFDPWFSNDAFEAKFRGSHDELVEQYRGLAEVFRGIDPVLDIGCGRGEFLEILREMDVRASGVEVDPELVRSAQELGLDVTYADGLEHLASFDDDGLGGIVLIQVVEHLTPQQVLDLVTLAAAKLRPGGKAVLETVNPQSLYVYSHAFYLDPTHSNPIHPAYLQFLFDEAGFAETKIEWRSDPPEQDVLIEPTAGAGKEAHAENVRRLNRLLFAPQDYALIATR